MEGLSSHAIRANVFDTVDFEVFGADEGGFFRELEAPCADVVGAGQEVGQVVRWNKEGLTNNAAELF